MFFFFLLSPAAALAFFIFLILKQEAKKDRTMGFKSIYKMPLFYLMLAAFLGLIFNYKINKYLFILFIYLFMYFYIHMSICNNQPDIT